MENMTKELAASYSAINEDHGNSGAPDLQVIMGTFVHATDSCPMVILKDTLLGISESKIKFVAKAQELPSLRDRYGFRDSDIQRLNSDQFMMPGLVDTHVHAPQFPNNGLALDLPLLEWLQKYTYPTEAQFADATFARDVYEKVVTRLLGNGTTTASYLSSLHLEGTKILTDIVYTKGQRALIGKVNMIRNCPDWYSEASAADSLRETEEMIHYIRGKKCRLVQPTITPRFAVTCTEELMSDLAKLAAKYDCNIQTHLSENRNEVELIKNMYPPFTATHLYDSVNLLSRKTVLAHCIWLSDQEKNLLAERGSGVSHCPNSNLSLASGICDVRNLLSKGINVGLGTDCSAGYSPSLLDALRLAVASSNALAIQKDPSYKRISIEEAFRLATLGGAKALDMGDIIGNFEVGKEFDALLIDIAAPGTPVDTYYKETSIEDKIHKFLLLGDDRNIRRVYVAGRLVTNHLSKE